MKYLNLTKDFNPYNAKDYECIHFDSFFFSGGEPHIRLDIEQDYFNRIEGKQEEIIISIKLKSMNDLGLLSIAKNTIDNLGYFDNIHLFIPYFPGARQDRICNKGEALTVKVYTDIINSMNFDSVSIFDPHSDVTPALLNNCISIDNHKFAKSAQWDIMGHDKHIGSFIYISPDAGSNKKMFSLMKSLDPNGLCKTVYCDKKRDVTTGKISGFTVNNILGFNGEDCIIFDDICDGGGTFIGLAKKLKEIGAGDLYLVVSHGIFSKGFKELKKHFKAIYTTDSWCNDYAMEIPEIEKGSEIVNIIKFNEFL